MNFCLIYCVSKRCILLVPDSKIRVLRQIRYGLPFSLYLSGMVLFNI